MVFLVLDGLLVVVRHVVVLLLFLEADLALPFPANIPLWLMEEPRLLARILQLFPGRKKQIRMLWNHLIDTQVSSGNAIEK